MVRLLHVARRSSSVVALALLGACGLLEGGGADGGDDLLAAGPDASPAADLSAVPPGDLDMTFVLVTWNLQTASLMGGHNNGFSIHCDDPMAGVQELEFLVTNTGTGGTSTTRAPCTAGASVGEAFLKVPDATGPFVVSATAVGKAMSSSARVKAVVPGQPITVRIYVDGCDMPECK